MRRVSAKAGTVPRGAIRIGISGWRYPPWRGEFYPRGLPQRDELAFASRALDTIEINGSHYALQTPESYEAWHDATPAEFVFSVKASRYITHMLKLRDVEQPLANFFASGMLRLREKLGPFLWQFPPGFGYDQARFEAFFGLLPRDTGALLALARRRDARMHGRSALAIDTVRPVRHAVEIRHASFAVPAFADLLRRHGIALVVADTAGKWPCLEDVTADFLYLRLHGDAELYASGYTDEAIARWARRIGDWSTGREPADAHRVGPAAAPKPRDVYCYFDNDLKVRAPFDARALRKALQLAPLPADATSPPRATRTSRRIRSGS